LQCLPVWKNCLNDLQSEHTALMMAAAAGKTAVATFLLQAGANVHLEDKVSCAQQKRNANSSS